MLLTEALALQSWTQYVSGDQEAFQLLFRTYYATLYTYGYKLLPHQQTVEDVIQEMFLELWNNKHQAPVRSVRAYLLSILKYKLLRQLNAAKTDMLQGYITSEVPFTINSETLLVAREEEVERVTQVTTMLAKLSSRQREIIYLRYYKNMDYDEISSIMHINYQASRNLLSQALKALRTNAATVTLLSVLLLVLWLL